MADACACDRPSRLAPATWRTSTRKAMMASAVMLRGVTSREFFSGVFARPSDGVDERTISVGISAALFVLPGFRHQVRGRNIGFRGDQMAVAAQHLDCVATP